MIASKILVPVDFSELGRDALTVATSLARDTGATLLIVHVEEPPQAFGGGELYYAAPEIDTTLSQQQLETMAPADMSIRYEHHLLSGDPASEIVHLAEREQVDLIVMGTHGRTGLMRLIMGSVAEAVVRRAPCPVFTLKHPHVEAVSQ